MQTSLDICLIAAMDRKQAIGYGNALPWHLPDDLKRFKQLTLNQPIVMGRKTAQSLGRALPKRRNLVLSRSNAPLFDGMTRIDHINQAIALAKTEEAPRLWVIGGGEIYRLVLPRATHLYLTLVDTELAEADTWFPPYDTEAWQETERTHHPADDKHPHAFDFVDLVRNPADFVSENIALQTRKTT